MYFQYFCAPVGQVQKGQRAAWSGLRKTVMQCFVRYCRPTKSKFMLCLASCSSMRVDRWLPEHIDPKITSKRPADWLKMRWGGRKGLGEWEDEVKPDPARGSVGQQRQAELVLLFAQCLNVLREEARFSADFVIWPKGGISSFFFLTSQQFYVLDAGLIDYSWFFRARRVWQQVKWVDCWSSGNKSHMGIKIHS